MFLPLRWRWPCRVSVRSPLRLDQLPDASSTTGLVEYCRSPPTAILYEDFLPATRIIGQRQRPPTKFRCSLGRVSSSPTRIPHHYCRNRHAHIILALRSSSSIIIIVTFGRSHRQRPTVVHSQPGASSTPSRPNILYDRDIPRIHCCGESVTRNSSQSAG